MLQERLACVLSLKSWSAHTRCLPSTPANARQEEIQPALLRSLSEPGASVDADASWARAIATCSPLESDLLRISTAFHMPPGRRGQVEVLRLLSAWATRSGSGQVVADGCGAVRRRFPRAAGDCLHAARQSRQIMYGQHCSIRGYGNNIKQCLMSCLCPDLCVV